MIIHRGILVLAAVLLLFQSNASGKLVAFLVVDAESKDIAADMTTNLFSMSAALEGNIPVGDLEIVKIGEPGGPQFSAQEVFNAISRTHVGPSDAILFYYCGHGYYQSGIGSFFQPPRDRNRRLFWRDIASQLKSKNARLTVSIVDSCSVIPGGVNGAAAPGPGDRPRTISPAYYSLFFQPKGTFHINSSSPGEYAICRVVTHFPDGQQGIINGSLFTSVLLDELRERQQLKTTWNELFAATRFKVHEEFRKIYSDGVITLGNGNRIQQRSQTVWAFDNGRQLK